MEFIQGYLGRWEALLAGIKTKLVFLGLADPLSEMERVFNLRGEDWIKKVSDYVARTPYANRRHLSGWKGMNTFFFQYQELCFNLITTLHIPVLKIHVSEENRSILCNQVYSWAFRGFQDIPG